MKTHWSTIVLVSLCGIGALAITVRIIIEEWKNTKKRRDNEND